MIVIIINREMAVDTTSELEPPTPPSDGLERDSSRLSMQYYSDTRTHTDTHTPYKVSLLLYQIPTSTAKCHLLYQTAPLRPAPDSFFDFSFSIIFIITKELLEKAWRQFYLAGR